ncbi:hypothetical protein Mapa_001100 [Marchantia paleacea]|nr:hypothetical protein Mapa_001100 [Marchantia paleacea]
MVPRVSESLSFKNALTMESLHPALPLRTRIAVVGGGPSGLAAALALTRLGFENVTVLERDSAVGGMCASAVIEGRAYDLGGQVLARDSSPTMRTLMKEMGIEMEDMSHHRLAEINCKDGSYEDLKVAADYMSIMSITLKLQNEAAATGRLGVHALSDLASQPADEFLRARGFPNGVPTAVANGFTASGYGYPSEVPYAYLQEFARTSMLGKIWRVKGGYGSFWEKVAASLQDVRCGVQVESVDRRADKVCLSVRNVNNSAVSDLEFDKLIMTGSSFLFSSKRDVDEGGTSPSGILDYTGEERKLFSRVQTVEYYTTVLKISGLDLPVGFYYPKVYKDDPKTIGHPVAIQRFFADSDIYLLWSYSNAEVDQHKMMQFLYEDVRGMGGRVDELILQRKWRYFPRVSSRDMADGFYDKMSEMQGQNNTYYLGALLAFELTERNVSYAFDLVKKHFGTTKEHPYVKRLMPPAPSRPRNAYELKELQELPGVEFPDDLPSLDAYLSHYAKHEVLADRVLYTWLDDQGREADRRTYAQLDFKASLVAHGLRFNGKTSLNPGDRVILLHPPGLDFIEAFFGCIRARVIPVPLIPPDPTQRAGQALAKVENVAKACEAKAILSTYAYHAAVRAASLKNILTVSTSQKTAPVWPDLPWHHTDSWTKRATTPWNWFFKSRSSSSNGILQLQQQSNSKEATSSIAAAEPARALSRDSSRSKSSKVLPLDDDSSSTESRHESVDDTEKKLAEDFFLGPPPDPSDLCFLQFTSGSTGDSKGVMISHGGLLHNVKLMRRQYRSTSRTVLISWLPQYHDMGLIGGLFTAMLSGGTAVLFSPTTFIRKPLLWLETMDKYKCTHSAGPNFAFELVVKRLETLKASGAAAAAAPSYDLSELRFLMISAEPIRHKTVQSFLELLRDSGLQEQALAPGYGLAENCVFVCVAYGAGLPVLIDWQGRVCCGYVQKGDEDIDIRIVNPTTSEEVGAGCEGEIWVCSPSIGVGYWGQKQLGERTFCNTIANESSPEHGSSKKSPPKTFLRTGDLGRVVEGKLFVTGRIKDLIIVRGRNLYPADIEKTVENCSDLLRPGCCAVFSASQNVLQDKGLSSSEEAGVVVVAEVRDEKRIDSGLQAQIMATVAEEYGVQVACVNFIKPRTIPKTTSGKIRRIECLKRFAENKLDSVQPPRVLRRWVSAPNRSASFRYSPLNSPRPSLPSPDRNLTKLEISDFLVRIVAERTGLPARRISIHESFANYSIDSVGIVWAAQKLSEFLGVHVAPIDIFTAGSIAELTDEVQKKTRASSTASSPSTPRTPRTPTSSNLGLARPNRQAITKFVIGLVAEKTCLSIEEISETQNLTAYNIDSVGVVWAAQKLSDYLGVHIPAIDIYTAGCIQELVQSAETSMLNSKQEHEPQSHVSDVQEFIDHDHEGDTLTDHELSFSVDPSLIRRLTISSLQVLGVFYIAGLLLIPAALIFGPIYRFTNNFNNSNPGGGFLMALMLVPMAWIMYMASIPVIISLLGCSLLQPNFTFATAIPLWSTGYVKWWTLHRLQLFASTTIATHLRGTVFLSWWYRLLGAHIGEGVQLDSIDLTDPCLLYVGDGVVIGEGATVQCHEVRAGIVSFRAVKINHGAQVGPFAVIQRGTILEAGASVGTLSKTDVGEHVLAARTGTSCPTTSKGCQSSSVLVAVQQLVGLYIVGLVSTAAAAVAYACFLWLAVRFEVLGDFESEEISRPCTKGFLAFAWSTTFPSALTGIAPLMASSQHSPVLLNLLIEVLKRQKLFVLLISLGLSNFTYGLTLAITSIALKWCSVGKLRGQTTSTPKFTFRTWLVHAMLRFTHSKFVSLLSGTEATCIYLRCLGARIGRHASIRRVNALVDPDLLSLGERSHVGDFANMVTASPLATGAISVGANCVIGAQSVLMPGAILEDHSMLGAMSVATSSMRLQSGGVYVGVDSLVRIFNKNAPANLKPAPEMDYRIGQMDSLYQKIVANLSASIGRTTVSVNARYFHRMGVGGKGMLRFFDDIPGLPEHDTFAPGRCFPVLLRHSNSLSGDDDARVDARGASIRILRPDGSTESDVDAAALLDLTLKTGRGFYARNMVEFVSWLTKNHDARAEHVKKYPHTADMIWDSLRSCDSYAEMHYFSNVVRLFHSKSDGECYVKFKLRPEDARIGEDCGRVEPTGLIPPETGAIPRSAEDDRPLRFLKDEFNKRVSSSEGVKYILQMQFCPISESLDENENSLDCTRAWDERSSPYVDVAVLHLTEMLDDETTESIRFNPRNGPPSLSMIPATSAFESASMDHGRALAYAIAQYLRNGLPLPASWQDLLKKADMPLTETPHHNHKQTGGCPALSGAGALPAAHQVVPSPETMASSKSVPPSLHPLALTVMHCCQPLLQTTVPFIALALASYPSLLALAFVGSKVGETQMLLSLPLGYLLSGMIFAALSVFARWALVGQTGEGDTSELWGFKSLCDTTWQSINAVFSSTFMDLGRGSLLLTGYFRGLGASIDSTAYVDTLYALNPDLLRIGAGSAVGHNALIFGHLYEGGQVCFKSVEIGDHTTVGTRSLLLPGLRMQDGSQIAALGLGMKNEIVVAY